MAEKWYSSEISDLRAPSTKEKTGVSAVKIGFVPPSDAYSSEISDLRAPFTKEKTGSRAVKIGFVPPCDAYTANLHGAQSEIRAARGY